MSSYQVCRPGSGLFELDVPAPPAPRLDLWLAAALALVAVLALLGAPLARRHARRVLASPSGGRGRLRSPRPATAPRRTDSTWRGAPAPGRTMPLMLLSFRHPPPTEPGYHHTSESAASVVGQVLPVRIGPMTVTAEVTACELIPETGWLWMTVDVPNTDEVGRALAEALHP